MIRFLLRNGFRKGLLGGSRVWLVLGGAGLLVRVLKKLGGSEEEVVLREELPVGTAIIVANEPR
ncbi:MAG TPA: hypothetical protein VFA94_14650 [Acidimicrobiales bacterium]|nr:hypothetical protein [Acidimicrobiales bacterium]